MKCQVEEKEHFRHLLLFEFNRGATAAEAIRTICSVYGEDTIGERTARTWFSRFKSGNFDLKDVPHTVRTTNLDEGYLNSLIQEDPRQTTRELANIMGCDHTTIVRHLKSMGKVQKLGSWVPHVLNENSKNQRVSISASLLARHHSARQQHQSFLSRIVTGDEKWCLYVNFKQRREWLSPDKQATPRAKQYL